MESWGVCGQGWRKGPWTPDEDKLLLQYITQYGEGRWSSVSKCTGLKRSGKSSRLRWVNYLRPGLKKGQLTPQEEGVIMELHALWGNRWSTIAKYLPGRTDNEIKNYWRTHFKKTTKPSSYSNYDRTKQDKGNIFIKQTEIDNKDIVMQDHTDIAFSRGMDYYTNHHQVVPTMYQAAENNITGPEFSSMDCYFWDQLDDEDTKNGCSKTEVEKQGNNNYNYYYCEGGEYDVDYHFQNIGGDYLF